MMQRTIVVLHIWSGRDGPKQPDVRTALATVEINDLGFMIDHENCKKD